MDLDHAPRLIGLALVVAWWIYRLARYLWTFGARRSPRKTPERLRADTAAASTAARSPIEPARGAGQRGDAGDNNPIK